MTNHHGSEHEVQTSILHYLNMQPDVFAWRYNSSGIYRDGKWHKKVGFDIKGVSDILGILYPYGITLAIEVKKPGSTYAAVTKEQKAFINKINEMGGAATWASSLEAAALFLEDVRRRNARLGRIK